MKLPLNSLEIRRCRPLLGTFVEIRVGGQPQAELHAAIEMAFREIERIQNLMSAHDSKSEVGLLNQHAFHEPVKVSDDTFQVLSLGRRLAEQSNGAFDFTVGAQLREWGFLPYGVEPRGSVSWREVQILSKNRVRFGKPLVVDLGGIAKGYAVDRGVEVLKHQGVRRGVVNAGGDLRVFGDQPVPIHLRHPQNPQTVLNSLVLSNAALATSAPYFSRKRFRGRWVSHLVHPSRCSPITHDVSVSVQASQCWLADGLTKVVLNAQEPAVHLLEEYHAEAFIIRANRHLAAPPKTS